MDTVYILHGTKIQRKDNTLRVVLDSGQSARIPVESIKHLVIPNACQMTSDVLTFLGHHQVRISFLDYYGNYQASLEPRQSHDSGAVHLAQAKIIFDDKERLRLAKTILKAAADNITHNVKYYSYRNKPLGEVISRLNVHRQGILNATSIESLMGSEGLLRQEYYGVWSTINPDLTIVRRTRRPPADRVNALISFGNGLMYSACRQAIAQSHLDSTLSFIHAPTQARTSLALDIAEIFKPVIIDRLIFRWANRNEWRDAYFDQHDNICLLTAGGRDAFVESFRHDMDNTPIGQFVGYRSVILNEVYQLEAYILGLREYHPFVRRV